MHSAESLPRDSESLPREHEKAPVVQPGKPTGNCRRPKECHAKGLMCLFLINEAKRGNKNIATLQCGAVGAKNSLKLSRFGIIGRLLRPMAFAPIHYSTKKWEKSTYKLISATIKLKKSKTKIEKIKNRIAEYRFFIMFQMAKNVCDGYPRPAPPFPRGWVPTIEPGCRGK